MKCHVKWHGRGPITQSDYSPEFPVDQEQSFDLNVFDIPDGAMVWAHYRIEAGKSGDTQMMAFGRRVNVPAVFGSAGPRSTRTASWSESFCGVNGVPCCTRNAARKPPATGRD